MILKKITLHPFAGIRNQTFTFESGLNVLCGPNDIGKSTLFRAIEGVFFLETKPKVNSIEGKFLQTLIPIGGDNAKVTAEFESGGIPYRLEKTWGAGHACRLELPDGTALNTQEKISEKLQQILPATEATFKSILLAGQNCLAQTIGHLEKNQDSLHSLGDVLRQAMSQTDGISVDRLKLMLQERIDKAFLRWETQSQGPQGGRGLENPWAYPGSILKSWYERENLKKQRNDIRALEALYGDKANLLAQKTARQAQAQLFMQEHEPHIEAIQQRKTLEAVSQGAKHAVDTVKADLGNWMKAENLQPILALELQRLKTVVANLKKEQGEAHAASGRKALIDRFTKIEAEHQELLRLKAAKDALPTVAHENIEALREALGLSERLKAGLSASKLALQFTARAALDLVTQKDLDPASKQGLALGQTLELQAGGRIYLTHDLFEIKISSGDGKMDQLEKNLKASEQTIRSLLEKLKVSNLAEALEQESAFTSATRKVETSERTLRSLLGQDRYEELKTLFDAAQTQVGSRELSIIVQEFSEASSDLGKKESDYQQATLELNRLKQLYGSDDSSSLLVKLSEKTAELNKSVKDLASLPAIPADIGDGDTLLTRFSTARDAFRRITEELPRLISDVAELRAQLSDKTSQEFDRQFEDADQAFQKELRAGNALQRVSQAVQALEARSTNVYSELQKEFEKTITQFSSGKYSKSNMTGSLPQAFTRQDGAKVPYEWLSGGTKDSFALALRLAMARYFLAARSGFLLVDDPMVAMDPDRQKIAAGLVKEFAEKTQVLVFTCHPSHAEILGGTAVKI
ncbi:MAG: AAA family ATPase [Methylotenera sp.]|nr:AAA family ATPase [Oligoflexia bacterium]